MYADSLRWADVRDCGKQKHERKKKIGEATYAYIVLVCLIIVIRSIHPPDRNDRKARTKCVAMSDAEPRSTGNEPMNQETRERDLTGIGPPRISFLLFSTFFFFVTTFLF